MLLLSAALTEPFYATPAQSLGNAIAALLVAVAFPVSLGGSYGAPPDIIRLGKAGLTAFAAALITISLAAILTKDHSKTANLSSRFSRSCRNVGSARTVYSILFISSSFALYAFSPGRLSLLLLAWFTIFHIKPLEAIASLSWKVSSRTPEVMGQVTRMRHPGLIEVLLRSNRDLSPGDSVGFEGIEASATVLDTGPSENGQWALLSVVGDEVPALGQRVTRKTQSQHGHVSAVGPVEPGSNLTEIVLRVPGNTERMREGNLLKRGGSRTKRALPNRLRESEIREAGRRDRTPLP